MAFIQWEFVIVQEYHKSFVARRMMPTQIDLWQGQELHTKFFISNSQQYSKPLHILRDTRLLDFLEIYVSFPVAGWEVCKHDYDKEKRNSIHADWLICKCTHVLNVQTLVPSTRPFTYPCQTHQMKLIQGVCCHPIIITVAATTAQQEMADDNKQMIMVI